MVATAEKHRTDAKRGKDRRFGRPPFSSAASLVQNRFLFIDHRPLDIERSGNQTADGSQYDWNVLYQGNAFNPVVATYNTPNGVFNPGQDSMLAPNSGMVLAGLSQYSVPQGFWGFYAQHERAIAFGASVVAGTALSLATWGAATLWLPPRR